MGFFSYMLMIQENGHTDTCMHTHTTHVHEQHTRAHTQPSRSRGWIAVSNLLIIGGDEIRQSQPVV